MEDTTQTTAASSAAQATEATPNTPLQATEENWTSQLQYSPANKTRPTIGRAANGFKDLLLKTLTSGALMIQESQLPIKVKSLRTQAVAIAKTAKAMSHVITRDGSVYMWLEPQGAYKRSAKSKPGPKPGSKNRKRKASSTNA